MKIYDVGVYDTKTRVNVLPSVDGGAFLGRFGDEPLFDSSANIFFSTINQNIATEDIKAINDGDAEVIGRYVRPNPRSLGRYILDSRYVHVELPVRAWHVLDRGSFREVAPYDPLSGEPKSPNSITNDHAHEEPLPNILGDGGAEYRKMIEEVNDDPEAFQVYKGTLDRAARLAAEQE